MHNKISDGFILSDEQTDALKQLETEKDNFFVTRKAGTGKSVLLRAFVERARDNKKAEGNISPNIRKVQFRSPGKSDSNYCINMMSR